MIAIGGGLALIGNTDQLAGVARQFELEHVPALKWEIKIVLVLFFVANALLRFIWAHRLFGYCAILMASVPNDPNDRRALPSALQAAEINITAARSFNSGLRCVYSHSRGGGLAGRTDSTVRDHGLCDLHHAQARIRLTLPPGNPAARPR